MDPWSNKVSFLEMRILIQSNKKGGVRVLESRGINFKKLVTKNVFCYGSDGHLIVFFLMHANPR